MLLRLVVATGIASTLALVGIPSWLLGDASSGSSDWLTPLGAFIPAMVIALGVIYDQRGQIREGRAREAAKDSIIQDMSDKNVAMAERVLPALTESTRVLSELLEERRRDRDRDR